MRAKYINPYTDFGFKKIFGEEASKPLLMQFLNSLLPKNHIIRNLSFKSTEQLGQTELDRKAIYDIYCESKTGEKFIVELQKAKQNYFIDRTIYYSTFPIREQAQKGEWDYNLKAVFCIGILDFTFDDPKTKKPTVIHRVKLKNQENNVFYDKLSYIYLEMPHFDKEEKECKTRLEKFLYFLKHLEDFENIPEIFKGEILFEKAFERAEIAKFTQAELHNYEMSLKVFRDLKNTMDYAVEEALKEGELKGIEKALKKMIASGMNEKQAKQILDI
jgi:predicted transposase/invertase (TIGR01784 family)